MWSIVTVFIIACLMVFIFVGSYSQRVRLTGSVMYQPAVVRVTAKGNGNIVRSFAEEGKSVLAGDTIFIVNMETQTEYGGARHEITETLRSQKAAIEREIALRSMASETEKNYLLQLLKNKESELQKLVGLISKSAEQVAWLLDKAQYFKLLVDKGIAIETQHIERRSDYYSASVQLEGHKREKVKLEGEVIDIKAKLAAVNSGLETSLEVLRRQSARVDQDLVVSEELREIHVVSLIDGTLTGITGSVGDVVREGQELASIVPLLGHAEVEVFAAAEAIGEITEGQLVRLRYDAYPYQWFGQYDGVVSSISSTSVERGLASGGENAGAKQQPKRYFQVRISIREKYTLLGGKTYPIRPGMGVETDIFLRKRPIYEWLLLPLKKARIATQNEPGGAA